MSMSFFRDGWQLHVDDPGYGRITVVATTVWDDDPDEFWFRELHGPQIGEFLTAVTARALDVDLDQGALPSFFGPDLFTPAASRTLLPALQEAAILATAGTDRYERVYPDPDEGPQPPLCARCNLGTLFTTEELSSAWCEQHGHRPFGASFRRWETAQEIHNSDVARWTVEQQRRDTTGGKP